jgi:hypothetical protein
VARRYFVPDNTPDTPRNEVGEAAGIDGPRSKCGIMAQTPEGFSLI